MMLCFLREASFQSLPVERKNRTDFNNWRVLAFYTRNLSRWWSCRITPKVNQADTEWRDSILADDFIRMCKNRCKVAFDIKVISDSKGTAREIPIHVLTNHSLPEVTRKSWTGLRTFDWPRLTSSLLTFGYLVLILSLVPVFVQFGVSRHFGPKVDKIYF